MSKKKFSTDRQVDALKPLPGQKRTDYHHTKEPGFICRVSESKKTFAISYTAKIDGKSIRRKVTIGDYPDISLADALDKARETKADARVKGSDIIGDREERKNAPTIADVMDLYLKEKDLTEKGRSESKRINQKDIIPFMGDMKANELRRQHVKDLHRKIAERGASIAANRTIELLGRAFNYAHEEELIESNPFPKIKNIKNQETSRDRVLTTMEIKLLWGAMEQESSNMRDIMRLLLLLGQRSTDTMSMKVSDIDRERKEWTVPAPPKSKNQKPNTLPLPPLAWSIIEPRLENDKWIFPSTHNSTRATSKGDGHTKSTKDTRRRLKEATGTEGWTAHDFRRTCRTIMSQAGVKPHIAERVLGHAQGEIEAIYDRYKYLSEKAAALLKVEKKILQMLGVEQEEKKIIRLKAVGE